jgi:hypothetical protein
VRGAIGPAHGSLALSEITIQRPIRLSLPDMSTAAPDARPAAPRNIIASPSNGILDRSASVHPFDEVMVGAFYEAAARCKVAYRGLARASGARCSGRMPGTDPSPGRADAIPHENLTMRW